MDTNVLVVDRSKMSERDVNKLFELFNDASRDALELFRRLDDMQILVVVATPERLAARAPFVMMCDPKAHERALPETMAAADSMISGRALWAFLCEPDVKDQCLAALSTLGATEFPVDERVH